MCCKQFLNVLKKWPLDKNKQGRDVAEHLRNMLAVIQQSPGISSNEQTERLTNQVNALNRLSNNIYYSKYKRMHFSTATGLSAKQCSQVLSSEFLQYLKEQKN